MNTIEQKERLYVNLRRILARQPGNEAREQMRMYVESLQEKQSKLKVKIIKLCSFFTFIFVPKTKIRVCNFRIPNDCHICLE